MDVWQGGADGGGGQVPSAKGPPESPENAPRLGFLSAPVPWKKKNGAVSVFYLFISFFCRVLDVGVARHGPARHVDAFKRLPAPPVGAPYHRQSGSPRDGFRGGSIFPL